MQGLRPEREPGVGMAGRREDRVPKLRKSVLFDFDGGISFVRRIVHPDRVLGMRWAAALLLVMLSGCSGILTWKIVFSSASPDRKAVLRVEESACFADCALQIVINRG